MVSLLRRWQLYRRWGPRRSWTGNNAHDIEVRQHSEHHWYAEGWSTCRCGKVRKVWAADYSEDAVRLAIQLRGELCRACKAWCDRRMNHCPDGNCTLTYEHKGRCKPLVVPDEVLAARSRADVPPESQPLRREGRADG